MLLHTYGAKTEVQANRTKPRTRHCGIGQDLSTQAVQVNLYDSRIATLSGHKSPLCAVREQVNASAAR